MSIKDKLSGFFNKTKNLAVTTKDKVQDVDWQHIKSRYSATDVAKYAGIGALSALAGPWGIPMMLTYTFGDMVGKSKESDAAKVFHDLMQNNPEAFNLLYKKYMEDKESE